MLVSKQNQLFYFRLVICAIVVLLVLPIDTYANNYTPYRRDILNTIYDNWHPPKIDHPVQVTVGLTIFRDRRKQECKILVSSGSKIIDKSALKAVSTSKIPWPDNKWFRANSIFFRITLDSSRLAERKKNR